MKKILVAEDDNFLANAYRVKLTKAGFEVQMARDGQEAITALQSFTPDLIVLDLIMPVKDGFATLAEIKANPAWKPIPVIVASNLGQKEDIEKSIQMGANDFVVKSDLSLDSLIEKVNALLASAPAPLSS
ncbi:MAG: response regulator [Patescibacteria group bacterium]